MVRKRADESEMQGEADDNKKCGNTFLYQNKKQKANPWNNFSNASDNKFSRNGFTSQTSAQAGFTSPTSSKFVSQQKAIKFDLESVWSVRKNVPLSNSNQKSQSIGQTGNSFYSRHAGGVVGSHQGKADLKAISGGESGSTSWQMRKPGYSYTNQSSLKRQADDIDDEFDFSETKKRSYQRDQSPTRGVDQSMQKGSTMANKGGMASVLNPVRRGSARTLRAQKMNEAYLKSAGLGFYTPKNPLHETKEDD